MTKLTIYATITARLIILLIGFIFLPLFFVVYIISLIAETYLNSLASFTSHTKELLTHFDKVLKSSK